MGIVGNIYWWNDGKAIQIGGYLSLIVLPLLCYFWKKQIGYLSSFLHLGSKMQVDFL